MSRLGCEIEYHHPAQPCRLAEHNISKSFTPILIYLCAGNSKDVLSSGILEWSTTLHPFSRHTIERNRFTHLAFSYSLKLVILLHSIQVYRMIGGKYAFLFDNDMYFREGSCYLNSSILYARAELFLRSAAL